MSTYTQLLYQFVFGSKDHSPFLDSSNEDPLFGYIAGILQNKKCHSYIVGGCSNHIHIVTHVHPTLCPAFLIKDIKAASHSMILKNRHDYSKFPGWQVGYSGFTYHISSKRFLIDYVQNQRVHHLHESFHDEIIRLLRENEIDFNEDYLFD
jgi:putative transposase